MAVIGPTFFAPYLGDHEPGDGLTRLQTTFASASAADVSQYAIGSGTSAFGTLYDGYNRFVATDSTSQFRYWDSTDFIPTTAWTSEIFFKDSWTNNTASIKDIKIAQFGAGDRNFDVVIQMQADQTTSLIYTTGTAMTYTGSPNFDVNGSSYMHHLALVGRSDSKFDFYIDGVRVLQDMTYSGSTFHLLQIFGRGASNSTFTATYYGVRIRRAVMYADVSSFTKPSGPEVWGPP